MTRICRLAWPTSTSVYLAAFYRPEEMNVLAYSSEDGGSQGFYPEYWPNLPILPIDFTGLSIRPT